MNALNRSAIGAFSLASSVTPDRLTPENIESFVEPPITAVSHLPRYEINGPQKERIYDGRIVQVDAAAELAFDSTCGDTARLILVDSNQQLVAVAAYRFDDRTAKPVMVFHDPPRD